MQNFLLTIALGAILGYVFCRLGIPGGMMVGSIIAVSIWNIATGLAFMPAESKVLAQIIAGAFIGAGIEKSDLIRLKHIIRPAIALLSGMLVVNIVLGFLMYFFSPMDLTTALMCAVPGGISEMPIISVELGADASKVALMQFIRLVFGVGVFPTMIDKVSKLYFLREMENSEAYKRKVTTKDNPLYLLLTLLIASTFGILGKISGIPSAILVFSMISIIILKLTTGKASMPLFMRRMAQVLSGAYIGTSIGLEEVLEMRHLVLPAVVLILGYMTACFVIGQLLTNKYRMQMNESMLAATPAGATDMALISADIGIESADVIVLQIIRMITVISLFPQIIRLIVFITE